MIQFDYRILFQMGWFNHHLENELGINVFPTFFLSTNDPTPREFESIESGMSTGWRVCSERGNLPKNPNRDSWGFHGVSN